MPSIPTCHEVTELNIKCLEFKKYWYLAESRNLSDPLCWHEKSMMFSSKYRSKLIPLEKWFGNLLKYRLNNIPLNSIQDLKTQLENRTTFMHQYLCRLSVREFREFTKN